ncbi:MAG: phosphoribosylamine--glycine ligase [Candidatus Limnocylindria bacterium]
MAARGLKVLVLGGGGREHALAWRLARDESVGSVLIAPGNGGTPAVGRNVPALDPLDPDAVARFAANERVSLAVIGPEAPLAAGLADALERALVPVCGPTRAAARLETSKAFAKEQLRRAGIPTPASRAFVDRDAALDFVRRSEYAPVVKADWLAAGKGVIVADSPIEAEEALSTIFGLAAAGASVLLEERVTGREVSVFGLVSGRVVVPLGAACDYKRLRDADAGPNTGGMGAYSPVPWFGRGAVEQVAAEVLEPIAWQLARAGTPYRGVLYAGMIITADGPMVLEFNARLGDPEAQVLLPLLGGDLGAALLGVASGDRALMEGAIRPPAEAAVGVVIASEGYPDRPTEERPILGAEPAEVSAGETLCYHGATRRTKDGYVATGGRVVTFVGRGIDLPAARSTAYRSVAGVELTGAQYRTDVAARELPTAPQPGGPLTRAA